MKEHFKLLGFKVVDKVIGFKGVVTSISFDLSGCIQALVCPEVNASGVPGDSRWFDTKRLKIISKIPIISPPSYDVVPGGQEYPKYESKPS